MLRWCLLGMLALYWLAWVLSLYNSKLAGAEMMAVMQVSFLAIGCLQIGSAEA